MSRTTSHRTPVVFVLAPALLVALAAPAAGRPTPRARPFVSNKTLGLGIMLGAPSGLAGKYYLGADTAVDLGLGAYHEPHDDGLSLHADFLWHPAALAAIPAFQVPIYFGVGGRLWLDDDDDGRRGDRDDDLHLGVRGPVGVMLDFNQVPLDVFFELVLVIDVIAGNDDHVDFGGALGARYYFR